MSIRMRDLSPETYRAMETLCAAMGWAEIYEYMEPEQVAWLAARLPHIEDDATTFPKGKWATIQRMQSLVDDAARKDVEESRSATERRL